MKGKVLMTVSQGREALLVIYISRTYGCDLRKEESI